MSESLPHSPEANQPQPEATPRQIEIMRSPNAQVLLNNDAELSLWGRKLADTLENGLPADWQPLPEAPHVYVGELDGQPFAAKLRRNRLNTFALNKLRRNEAAAFDDDYFGKATQYAFESLTNEIHQSPTVKTVISHPKMQEAARATGASSLRFIEPVAGVIARHNESTPHEVRERDHAGTGVTKFMVYEYVPGLRDLHESPTRLTNVDEFADKLEAHLQAAGLEPGDFRTNQLKIDDQNNLYLIDSEGYTPTTQRQREATERRYNSPSVRADTAEAMSLDELLDD